MKNVKKTPKMCINFTIVPLNQQIICARWSIARTLIIRASLFITIKKTSKNNVIT